MRVAYLDCFAGAAGDMLVAACLDAGLEVAALSAELERLELGCAWRFEVERVRRQTIAGTHVRVVHEEQHAHRGLADITKIVEDAGFAPALSERMLETFRVLAQAEAKAHGIDVERVHFHEVGAVDAIIDVCATVVAFDLLGIERCYASEIVIGSGSVRCEHGEMPVPAPGTAELLRGLPVRLGSLRGERCTPTGAALLRTLVDEFAAPLSLRPECIGYGAGTRDDGPTPNLLRITIGAVEDDRERDRVFELSTQVDNVSGEALAHALRRCFEAGALDAYAIPAITKKNRPAHCFVAICDEAARDAVEVVILSELPTLGLRRNRLDRRTLPRRVETRSTALGPVRYKVRTLPDGSEIAQPEADDVERLARERGIALPLLLEQLKAE